MTSKYKKNFADHHAQTVNIDKNSPQNENLEIRAMKSLTFNMQDAHLYEPIIPNDPALGTPIFSHDSNKAFDKKFLFSPPQNIEDKKQIASPVYGEHKSLMNAFFQNRQSENEIVNRLAQPTSNFQERDKSTFHNLNGLDHQQQEKLFEPGSVKESCEALHIIKQNDEIKLSQASIKSLKIDQKLNNLLSPQQNENQKGSSLQIADNLPKREQQNEQENTINQDPLGIQIFTLQNNQLQPINTRIGYLLNQNSSRSLQDKIGNGTRPTKSKSDAGIFKSYFDNQYSTKLNPSTLQSKVPFQLKGSFHLHRLSNCSSYLQLEKLKLLFILSSGVVLGILQIVSRGMDPQNLVFNILAGISIVIQVLCFLPLIIRLQQIASDSLKSFQSNLYLICLICSNLFRITIFTSSSLSDLKQKCLQVVAEIFIISQLIYQALSSFPIFRRKEKIYFFESLIIIVTIFSLLIGKDERNDPVEIAITVFILIFFLLKLFLFREFPYSIFSIYDAKHEQYSEMMKSYITLIASDCSQLNSGATVQIEKQLKIKEDQSEMWRLKDFQAEKYKQTLIDVTSVKQEAKKMLADTSVIVFLNKNLIPTFISNKMKNEIDSIFKSKSVDQKEETFHQSNNQNLFTDRVNQLTDRVNQLTTDRGETNLDQLVINENWVINETDEPKHLQTPQAQTTPITQQIQVTQLHENTLGGGDSTNIKVDKTIANFQKLMEKIILERIDNQSLISWESLKKMNHQDKFSPIKQQLPNNFGENIPLNFNTTNQNLEVPSLKPSFNTQPLHLSQFQSSQQVTYKDLITAKNSISSCSKPFPTTTQNNIGFSSRIGLKSKYLMISLKDFLENVSKNPMMFEQFNTNNPIIVASFHIEGEQGTNLSLQKFQIKIYPKWNQSDQVQSLPHSIQSIVGMTTSKKYNFQENEQEGGGEGGKGIGFLISFEEVKVREQIVSKTQFYKLLKSILRCFNNDLIKSLANILGTSQAGAMSKQVNDEVKDKFISPILLSCKIIKYILHNLRDFNDIVGEKFSLQIRETSILKVAEDSVMLFKATSDSRIKFKVYIDDDVSMVILTDQRRLVQIILTLLSNAHKHTQNGSLTFRIFHPKVSEQKQNNCLRFQIEDTGDGMEECVQGQLSKLFSSGIGIEDFKTISTFGFNLFICNILAKKLYLEEPNFSFQDAVANKEFVFQKSFDGSGIKFTSNLGEGSIFYFDIKLFEERKNDKIQDSIFNYGNNALHNPLDFSSPYQIHRKSLPSSPFHSFTLNSERIISFPSLKKTQIQRYCSNTTDFVDIPDEEVDIDEKYDQRIMTFKQQPKGLHSDYKFLKCDCKNILIADKVQRTMDSMEILLKSFSFQAQKCYSLKEALIYCQQKSYNQCTICKLKSYTCIFVSIEEFYKKGGSRFTKEFENFSASSYCKDSILIVVVNTDSQTMKWLENLKIDDFLNTTFDNIELQNIIDKWKLLPYCQQIKIDPSISNVSKIS